MLNQQNPNNSRRNIEILKQRWRDYFFQDSTRDIYEFSKSSFYKLFKQEPQFEEYLYILPFKKRKALTKFRNSNHQLPI